MRKISLILVINLLILSSKASPEEINPYSYRKDFYKMPVQNEVQERALRPYDKKMNWGAPSVAPDYPVEVTDQEGNKTIFQGGKAMYSVSISGDITYFANSTKTHSKKILSDGSLYLFRKYIRHSPLVEIVNEFGQTIGYEGLGLDNKVLTRFDAFKRPLYQYEYDNSGYWEYDFVNNIWKRYEQGLPKEERRGSKDGPLIAYWVKGEFFGKYGLWRIEVDRGKEIYFTRYDEFGREDYEKYDWEGNLISNKIWENHRPIIEYIFIDEQGLLNRRERFFGDFGINSQNHIVEDTPLSEWRYTYNGSVLVSAENPFTFEKRVFDINGNIDKIINTKTGEIIEDYIYFSEVKNLSKEELKEFLGISEDEIVLWIYDWIQEMKKQGKADASLFGIVNPSNYTLSLYERNNQPGLTIYTYKE